MRRRGRARVVRRRRLPGGLRALGRAAGERAGGGEGKEGERLGEHGELFRRARELTMSLGTSGKVERHQPPPLVYLYTLPSPESRARTCMPK